MVLDTNNPTDPTHATEHALPPDVVRAAHDFAQRVQQAFTREFTFLLVGRTGVGKSSTINQLIGQDIAPVGDFEPTTISVEEYRLPIENVKFVVYDTPGLCDDLPEKGNDEEYIRRIKNKIKTVDCMLYVTMLHDKRVRSDEIYGIDLITKTFGQHIWKNSVIVFTFADYIRPDVFHRTLSERTRLIREVIGKSVPIDIVNRIPAVAVDNSNPATPDGTRWIDELYTTVVERVSRDGYVQYIATAPEIIMPVSSHQSGSTRIYGSGGGSYVSGSAPLYMQKKPTPEQIARITTRQSEFGVPTDPKPRETFFQIVADKVSRTAESISAAVQKGWQTVKGWFNVR